MLVLFFLALAIRLILISHFSEKPVNDLLWNDAVGWNLAQGNGFTASYAEPRVPGIYRSPGYPAFLALIYSVFGHSYTPVFVAQSILDALSAILIGRIVLLYFNPLMAFLTSLLYALYPYPGMFCGRLHQDILLIFCFLLSLLFISSALKKNSIQQWILAGLMMGFTALVKPNFLIFAALPIAAIVIQLRDRRLISIAMFLCAMTLTLIPWFWRNYATFHRFPPLSAGATGSNLQLLLLELNGGEEAVRNVGLAQPRTSIDHFQDGSELIDSQKKEADQAIHELMRRWPEYFTIIVKHIPRLWISTYSRWYGGRIALMGTILSWIVLVLGLVGMFLLRRDWRRLFPLYFTVLLITLLYAPYTVEARYTLPARPVMLCFVAASLVWIARLRNNSVNVPSPSEGAG